MESLRTGHEERHLSRLLRRARLSESVFEIEIERPPGFVFAAGQHVRIFADGEGRDYSMTSGPTDATLAFCVKKVGGAVSSNLENALPGSTLSFSGPRGIFALIESPRPIVWAATGVGIAPFVSMVRAGAAGFTLLHGVRQPADLLYKDQLEPAASRYVPCLSGGEAPGCYRGRVTAWAADRLPRGEYDFFVCGNRVMIRDFLLLVDERCPGSRVYTEIFF